MQPRDRIDVVLDVYTEADAYRVAVAGVLRPGHSVPPVPAGATRNIVQTWFEVPHTVRAFALHCATAEPQAAAAAIDRVRSLHQPAHDWSWKPLGCQHDGAHNAPCRGCRGECWPCPTIRALDGQQDEAEEVQR